MSRIDIFIFLVRGESINYVNCHIQEIPENGMIIMYQCPTWVTIFVIRPDPTRG